MKFFSFAWRCRIVLMSFKSWFQCQAYGGWFNRGKTASPWLRIQWGELRRVETERRAEGKTILWKLQNFPYYMLTLLYDDFKHVKILFHYVWMRHVLNMFFSSHHVWGKNEQHWEWMGVETHSHTTMKEEQQPGRLNVKKWNLRIWKQQQQ